MIRAAAATVVALLMLTGCGDATDDKGKSSSTAPTPDASSTQSSAADATYFTEADSAAINVVARKSQAAAARAMAPASERRCNRAGAQSYDAWRACWHGLLDPYTAGLSGVGAEFELLAKGAYPDGCVGELEQAKATFTELSGRVATLLAGIDSSVRKAQARAMKTYNGTISAVETSYTKPFQAITQVCYSPADLAKIKSSPSASPGS